jgi:hypothetical protein
VLLSLQKLSSKKHLVVKKYIISSYFTAKNMLKIAVNEALKLRTSGKIAIAELRINIAF